MQYKNGLDREGDVNFSSLREQWANELGESGRKAVAEDAAVFMKQSMSTPCLDGVDGAEGCYLYLAGGKKCLDFHGNSVHQVGYKNPYVVAAVKKQLDTLPFIPRRYTSEIAVKAANMLVDKTCSRDFKVLFTPSGSAAVGMALKIARKVTGRHKILSMWESFHGAGLDSISVGGEYAFSKDMGPLLPGCLKTIPYNAYRNPINSSSPQAVARYCLDQIRYIIKAEGDIGALLLEPIRATDTHIPPDFYFQELREICDKNGILLILDEIPTALGRSGEFYVHQKFGIEPDILVLGKGLGGGIIPQAAVLAKSRCDTAEEVSLGHYTHEKPAVGCAAICAAVEYLEDFHLLENCRARSAFAEACANELWHKYDCIGDFRIAGLLMTFELVRDRETKEKAGELAERILYYCLERGLSFKLSSENCITWHPPLVVTDEQLAFAFQLFEEALRRCNTFTLT